MNAENKSKIESPCIRNCCLDDHEICLGCFRTVEEIIQWTTVGDDVKQQFLLKAEARRKLAKR